MLTRLDEQRRDTAFLEGKASMEKGFIKSGHGPLEGGWGLGRLVDPCEVLVLPDWGSCSCRHRVQQGEPQLPRWPEAGVRVKEDALRSRDARGVCVRLAAPKGRFFIYRSIPHPLSSVWGVLQTSGKTRSRFTVGLPWVYADRQREGQGGGG